ncbi:hypothetical protein I5G61_gp60 [Mycobacterium phage Quesadilla]|uniref:Uncharacterized protein n=1 Tax=Mycobacterium phage Quesadilla TaxID=2664226 RepID=A0A5Q2WD52_9CAUD|nr:hypothetical protein I5G61_gp60 [Mycobacterium phage Quesadilla]QGH75308.1 hypothetical protein SEA_QUESADILLA_60 [Mycobacterium phage Quesadilla]
MTQPTAPPGITFLRSTTKTVVDREADGDIKTEVRHLARFAVRDNTLLDLVADSGRASFSPNWMEVHWENGRLERVMISGPQRLKGGKESEKVTRHHNWGRWGAKFERADLPAPVAQAIAAYETAVSTMSGAR